MAAATDALGKRVTRAREMLKEQGVEVPTAASATPGGSGTVSFTRQVAPLLVAKCGGCHIQRSRGELSMATYAALAKGSAAGAVMMPGNAKGSRVIELIEAGDMPRGGSKVAPEELAMLATWINEGAKFDGTDPATPLADLTPGSPDDTNTTPAVVAATGNEEIQFARDLGSVFVEHCLGCHGEQNPRKQFSVANFRRLLRGGDSGPVIVPGMPAESLLVKKLRGQASGERMPQGKDPLPEATIAKIEKWIALEGKFDGPDAAAPLEEAVALAIALSSTHEELTKSRAELAERNWRLILPDTDPHREETANVLIYGAVGRQVLADVARVADDQTVRLTKLLKLPADRPLVKGRLTLYVFDKRYDYGEVGMMLEHRELPTAWRGHWRYTGVDAYGCILLDGDEVPPGLVAQQIAGAAIASFGKIPRWFAEGTARAVAARVDPRDPRVRGWEDEADRLSQSVEKPEGFLSGQLPPEDADVLSYGFVKYLLTTGNRYTGLVAELAAGKPFDEAFAASYGGTPAELAAAWKLRGHGRRGR